MGIEFIIPQPQDAKTITRLVCNTGHTDTLIAEGGWKHTRQLLSTEGLSGQQVKSSSVRNSLMKHGLYLIRMSNTMDRRGVGRFVDSTMRRATVDDGNSIHLVNDKYRTQYV